MKKTITKEELISKHAEIKQKVKNIIKSFKNMQHEAKSFQKQCKKLADLADKCLYVEDNGCKPSFKKLPDIVEDLERWACLYEDLKDICRSL